MDESTATRHGFGGAFGAAKSHGIRLAAIARSLSHPGRRLILRRKKKELVENHIEPLFKQFPFMRSWYNQQNNALTFPGGKATIVFGYAEHPARNGVGNIYDFQGSEWDDIFIDEASHFNEEELTFMSLRCRTTDGSFIPKNVWAMNPGNIGHTFINRVMIERNFTSGESPSDYDFMPAFGWDNVQWVRPALEAAGIPIDDYYASFTDAQRFEWFTTKSAYGRVLNSLKGKLREARLMGDWKAFAGQFFDIWNEQVHVVDNPEIKPWWPHWVSGDWGYQHNLALHWHAQDGDRTITYREAGGQHISPSDAGALVARLSANERIQAFYLSPDAFELSGRKWSREGTIAQQINDALVGSNVPPPEKANNARISGWRLMYDMLNSELWTVASCCKRLIETIPILMRDEDNREDVLKVDSDEDGQGGDDYADGARYGLASRLNPVKAPVQERIAARIDSYATRVGIPVEMLEQNTIATLARKAQLLEAPRHRARFRPGRPYSG